MASDTPTKPPDSEPVQIRFGRYLIHRLLGIGGMAEIYQASVSGPAGFQKPVVIKRVRSQYAQHETFVQMFVDEARICASLDHANLVTVFDFGQEDGHYYMAMELVDGMDLRTAHVRYAQAHGQPLPWGVSTVVVRDALRGLDYAHNLAGPDGQPLGIVHRDIDLANIMVRRDGAVKVLDFGCAKASSAIRRTQTVAGVIKGKLGYMSPEQAEDRPLDGRSDVFAASIVLHELLTGRRLFFGDEPVEVIRSVLTRPIPDPREKNPAVPQALVDIVLKGLARDPQARYPSAAAMADALEAILHEHHLGQAQVAEVFTPLIADHEGARTTGFETTRDERKLTLAAWTESTGDAEPLEIISGVLLEESGSQAGVGGEAVEAVEAVGGEGGSPAGATAGDSVADAPFIDATIITTNPRWMLPDEGADRAAPRPLAEGAASIASGETTEITETNARPGAEAPPVDLHGAPTALVDTRDSAATVEALSDLPDPSALSALSAQETVLLTEADRKVGPLPQGTEASVAGSAGDATATSIEEPLRVSRGLLPWLVTGGLIAVVAGLVLYWLLGA